ESQRFAIRIAGDIPKVGRQRPGRFTQIRLAGPGTIGSARPNQVHRPDFLNSLEEKVPADRQPEQHEKDAGQIVPGPAAEARSARGSIYRGEEHRIILHKTRVLPGKLRSRWV